MPANVTEILLRKILAKHDLEEAFGILASQLKRDELVTVLMALHENIGFVDWSQQFLSDRKERMLINAIGTEIFCKKYLTTEK